MARRARRWSVVALGPVVLVVALRATNAAPSWAATVGACEGDSGVTVVVDFGTLGGGVATRCAPEPVSSGFDALARAGFTYEGTARFPGLLCRIDGKPSAKQDACQSAPSSSYYWAYWTASTPGGAWTYSDMGAGNRDPAPGSVEGWAFSDGCKRQPGDPQTCAGSTTGSAITSTTASGTTPTTRASSGSTSNTDSLVGTAGTTVPVSGPSSRPDAPATAAGSSTTVAGLSRSGEGSLDDPTALADAAGSSAEDRGSPRGMLIGGAAVAALGATAVARRRRNARTTPTDGE